jgi:hypothetical protein
MDELRKNWAVILIAAFMLWGVWYERTHPQSANEMEARVASGEVDPNDYPDR